MTHRRSQAAAAAARGRPAMQREPGRARGVDVAVASRAVIVALLSLSAACRVAPPPACALGGATAGAPAAVSAGDATPPASDPACDGEGGLVAIPRGAIAARWDHHLSYAGEGVLDVHWCGAGTVHVRQVVLGDKGRWIRDFVDDANPVRRGAPVALAIRGQPQVGALPALVTAVDESGGEHHATATIESVDDPDRSAAITDCRACGGTWGPIGMAGTETCDCATHDAGRRCTSDDDCEGACIATGWEPLSPVEVAQAGVRCARGHRLERQIGRCHGRQHAFGCRPRIADAAPRCQPVGLARRLDTICSD